MIVTFLVQHFLRLFRFIINDDGLRPFCEKAPQLLGIDVMMLMPAFKKFSNEDFLRVHFLDPLNEVSHTSGFDGVNYFFVRYYNMLRS